MVYLEDNRTELTIPAKGSVEIRVDFIDGEVCFAQGKSWLECVPCEAGLEVDGDAFVCPSCENKVTSGEVNVLACEYIEAIRASFCEPSPPKRRGRLWRFIHWFRKSEEPKA